MFKNKIPTQMTVVKHDGAVLTTKTVTREFLSATLNDMTEGNIVTIPHPERNKLYIIPVNKVDHIAFDFEDEDGDD